MLTTRVPNLFHLLVFLFLAILALFLSEGLALAIHHGPVLPALANQRVQLLANSLTYLVALALAFVVFPLLWHRPFLSGLSWNAAAAAPRLIGLGLVLGFATQAFSAFLPHVKDLPIDLLFRNPATIWLLVLFGTFLAPLFEEIVFRGFLLPAIAIGIDWLRLPRHPDQLDPHATLEAWRASQAFSPFALIVSSILTSLLFALIHAPQLGRSWPNVAVLAVVSLVLCSVRLRTRSVAASTLTHGAYNASVFLTLFIATGGFRHLERVT